MRPFPFGMVLAAAVFLAHSKASIAETVDIDAPISAVALFVDRAEITRHVSIELPAGEHRLIIDDLPGGLLADSLRAQSPGIQVYRVALSERATSSVPRQGERELIDQLKALDDEHRIIEDQITVQQIKLDFIRAMGKGESQAMGQSILSEGLTIDQWQQAWGALTGGAGEALDAIRQAEAAQQELEEQIERIEQQLELIRNESQTLFQGQIDISAKQSGSIDIELIYQVNNASWQPGYVLDLDTGQGQLQVIRQALIRQASGEDWTNVPLSLSTALPSRYAAVPELQPWFIDVQKPRPEMVMADAATARFATESAAVTVDAGEFYALYKLEHPATIPSDRSTHVITLASDTVDVDLDVLVAPAQSTNAILTGEITSPSAAPFLSGKVQLFRDGTFVTDNWIDAIQPGETMRLSFGIDDRVRVNRRLDTGQRSSEGLIRNRRRSERIYLIDVANNHSIPLEITVMDRLPVSQDDRIDVSLLDETTPPTSENVDGRRGVLAWSHTFQPDEERQIIFGFAVTRPDGVEVPGF